MNASRRQGGFTLLEVLVALAVVAIALGAILEQTARYASTAQRLREKTLALWVAHNRLTEFEVQALWPPVGSHSMDVSMGGTTWTSREQISPTADPSVRRIDVRVFHGSSENSVVTLSAFVNRYGHAVNSS